MQPCVLQLAFSSSHLPIPTRHLSLKQEGTYGGFPNKYEGLATVTAIADSSTIGTATAVIGGKNRHSQLATILISKILHLRETLGLPCQSSSAALDELLINTLEALKSAYPRCLSDFTISGHHASMQQGLVHLHKVLKLVQDSWAECKQLDTSSFEKHTIIESLSFEQAGECVIQMLDRVTPRARKMFNFMEGSISACAKEHHYCSKTLEPTCVLPNTSNSTSRPMEFPKRTSLPPLLRPPRYPSSCQAGTEKGAADNLEHYFLQDPFMVESDIGGGDHDDGVGTTSCEHDSTVVGSNSMPLACSHMQQSQKQEASPQHAAAVASYRTSDSSMAGRPISPSPVDAYLQQRMRPSVSPTLLTPPPSPIPVVGLPMLLQSLGQDCASMKIKVDPRQDGNASIMAASSTSPSTTPTPPLIQLPASFTIRQAAETSPPPLQTAAVLGYPQTQAMVPPPPPPPGGGRGGSTSSSSALSLKGSAPPPPPPLSIAKALRAKKASTKLKRSTRMGNLYRVLKAKVEGSCSHGKRSHAARKSRIGSNGDKAQGMADALAEMTKRSAYFRQIEEDVENHAATVLEIKSAIGSFQSKDVTELVKFHQYVEHQLACLTDETQVLARFEGFPSKKLETLRMAAALHSKLDGIVSTLKGWKLIAPISQQLTKVECCFNKIKDEVDMIERNKDEEMKRFQGHNIHFDFGVLVRIKECMVDLSSSCIEMALKESEEAKEGVSESKTQATALSRMLWRVFQLAFRVYSFAGGQDDRADRLTSMLAHEIEAHPL